MTSKPVPSGRPMLQTTTSTCSRAASSAECMSPAQEIDRARGDGSAGNAVVPRRRRVLGDRDAADAFLISRRPAAPSDEEPNSTTPIAALFTVPARERKKKSIGVYWLRSPGREFR